MTMAIFRDNDTEQFDFSIFPTGSTASSHGIATAMPSTVPLVASKLQTPTISGYVAREWLLGLLDRSARNAAATMLIGRAGAGKTALAAGYAARVREHSWYSIDSTDADWASFQNYFRAALLPTIKGRRSRGSNVPDLNFSSSPMELFADIAASMELRSASWPSVLILDGIHHLYDSDWFAEFFSYLVPSMPHTSHALMIARSRPTAPVWRMRSKQVLNVIDEKLLAFSLAETQDLFARQGLGRAAASRVHAESYGRPAEIMGFLDAATVA